MCLQAGAVLNAETSDFLFNRRDLKALWALSPRVKRPRRKMSANLDLFPRIRLVELYLSSPIHHDMLLN
jgi:hypothetical protein